MSCHDLRLESTEEPPAASERAPPEDTLTTSTHRPPEEEVEEEDKSEDEEGEDEGKEGDIPISRLGGQSRVWDEGPSKSNDDCFRGSL